MDDQTLSSLITLSALAIFAVCAWSAYWLWRGALSGWARLASVYGSERRTDSSPRRGQTLCLMPGGLKYRWVASVRLTVDGFYLSLAAPFSLGHEPLLIPYNDIEIFAVETYPADRLYDLKFAHEPGIRIRVGVAIAQGIRRAADNVQYFAPPTPPPSVTSPRHATV